MRTRALPRFTGTRGVHKITVGTEHSVWKRNGNWVSLGWITGCADPMPIRSNPNLCLSPQPVCSFWVLTPATLRRRATRRTRIVFTTACQELHLGLNEKNIVMHPSLLEEIP